MKNINRIRGGSLAELMVTIAVSAVVGGMLYASMHTIFELAAKNQALNYSHQQGRNAIDRVLREVRNSVSAPVLIDANFVDITSTYKEPNTPPPGAGIRYQSYFSGPHVLASTVSLTSSSVKVQVLHNVVDNRVVPASPAAVQTLPLVGMKLVVPVIGIEAPISAASFSSTGTTYDVHQLTLSKLPTYPLTIVTTGATPSPLYACYYMKYCALVVVNHELRYYDNSPSKTSKNYVVLARDVYTPTNMSADVTPFTFPVTNPTGTPRSYVRMNLPLVEKKGTARAYVSIDSMFDVVSEPKAQMAFNIN